MANASYLIHSGPQLSFYRWRLGRQLTTTIVLQLENRLPDFPSRMRVVDGVLPVFSPGTELFDLPRPGDFGVLVKVRAAGINRADVGQLKG
jgi:hypothetical protein